MKVATFKMPFKTNAFNINQRVWIRLVTGDWAYEVVGKWRGNGRYVAAWVKWNNTTKPAPVVQVFEVSDVFANTHGLMDGNHFEAWNSSKPMAT